MAKRFIDTGMFSDSWFCELTPNSKLLYIYLITKCDHAGIIDLNIRLAEFETGIKQLAKSFQTVRKDLGNRLVSLRDNYYILPKFVKYQYPKGLNANVKAQQSVINRLREFDQDYNSLLTVREELSNSSLTVQDKDTDTDKDKDMDSDKVKKKRFIHPEIWEVKAYFCEKGYSEESATRAFNGYDAAEWHDTNGKPVRNWKQKMNNVWFKPENLTSAAKSITVQKAKGFE